MTTLTTAALVTTIRPARRADIPALVALGVRFIQETGYAALIGVNEGAIAQQAAQLIDQAAGPSILLVAERCCGFYTHGLSGVASHLCRACGGPQREHAPIGMFGMLVYPHPLSGERTATELMWWMNPEARGAGLRLFRAGERWAKEQGAVLLQMIAPTEEIETLYTRLGFVPVERTFQKRLA